MELRQIKHFTAVVETGSFTKASERVSLSQPALSASIARLEDEFQVKLLERRRTRVVPTAAGSRLMERAQSILLVCNSVKAEVRNLTAPQPLRVGVLRTLSTKPITELIRSFRNHDPITELLMVDGDPADLNKRLNDGRVDAIITSLKDEQPDFNTKKLFIERFVVAVPQDHRFAKESRISLADLHDEPLVTRTNCETYAETTRTLQERNIKPKIVFRTDQDDRALSLVAAGVGISLVPELFETIGVKQLELSDLHVERIVAIQWAVKTEKENLALDEFVRFVSSHNWGRA